MRLTRSLTENIPPYGDVMIVPRRNCRRLILRPGKNGGYILSVPFGYGYTSAMESLKRMLPKLAAVPPRFACPDYSIGRVIPFEEGCVRIDRSTRRPDRVVAVVKGHDILIGVGSELDAAAPETVRAVSSLIKKSALYLAPGLLLPRAAAVAARIGIAPSGWKIGRGASVLGTYHPSDGHISLSGLLVLLPYELRDYIVCHELAHITHCDHSPAFHRLCDAYCGGREKELIRRLKDWQWPILR